MFGFPMKIEIRTFMFKYLSFLISLFFHLCKQSKIRVIYGTSEHTLVPSFFKHSQNFYSIVLKLNMSLKFYSIALHVSKVLLHCIGKSFILIFLFDMHALTKQFIGIDTLEFRVHALFFLSCMISPFFTLELRIRALFLFFVFVVQRKTTLRLCHVLN